MFCSLSFASQGVEPFKERPRLPKKPIVKTKTPYTLTGTEGDCSLRVLEYKKFKTRRRRAGKETIKAIFSAFPQSVIELKKVRREYQALDKSLGLKFSVFRGVPVGGKTPLARGSYRVYSKDRKLISSCSHLRLEI